MLAYLVASALITAPFSGVTVDNLLDRPMMVSESVLELSAAEVSERASATLTELDGRPVAETQQDFELNMELELPAGRCLITVEAQATSVSNDSYWVSINGERLESPILPPIGIMAPRSTTVDIPEAGRHTLTLSLRESPGSFISSVSVATVKTDIPHPPMRAELLQSRPRLLFTAADIEAMRARVADPRVQRFYTPASVRSTKPPAFQPDQRNGAAYRTLGNFALSHLLAPDEQQLASVLEWLEMAATFDTVGVDLDAAYFMEGLALTYDWLYDEIPSELRDRLREVMVRQCALLYKASLAGATGGGRNFQQNHYWYAHLALALGAVALYGEEPAAEQWLAWAWDRYERIALSFSPDGSFHEGPSYWDFSMPTLYLYTDLYEWCTGLRIPDGDQGLAGQAQFRFHHLYPGLERSAALEDSPVTLGQPAPGLLLWEAKRFRDPATMGMAQLLASSPRSDRHSFLWLDESVPWEPVSEAVPLARYYADVETAFARTSWDQDATYVAFVSRPLGGHRYAELCVRYGIGGTGHNHPAQNHFVLFGRGAVLAGDPGYTYEKKTRNHNTVLVDGQGQYGDGERWPGPNPGRAHVARFATDGDVTIVTGDATSAYPPELGLTRFERTLVLAGRDLVVIYDQLAAAQPRTFSWLLQHWGQVSTDEERWSIVCEDARLTVAPLLPDGVVGLTGTHRPQYTHPTRDLTPENADVNELQLQVGPVTETVFLVPLMVADATAPPDAAQDISTDTCYAVRVGDVVVGFNRGEGMMTVPLPWGEEMDTEAVVVVARIVDGERHVVTAPSE
jgi:hypothetical protein